MNTMKAIVITNPGGAEVLQLQSVDIPKAGSGQVLIKVLAAGVNRPDIFQRAGNYPAPPGASPLLGLEVAGEIVGGDLNGQEWKIGDRVCALTPGGGYAEYCIAPASHCLPIPKGLTPIEAAALPETCFTVWSNVFDIARLSPGERLLVHGGASGIGTIAIQMATALGHTVYATAGSEERVRLVNTLGAHGINYKEQDFVDIILKETQKQGVNVVLDMVCGDYLDRDIKCMSMDGRIVVIAQLGGQKSTINAARLMSKRILLTGSTLRPRSDEYKAYIAQALRKHVWPLIESGQIKPIIHSTLSLAQASQAHQMIERGEVAGKIVLST